MAVLAVGVPPSLGAEAGGTVEVDVRYHGAPLVETMKVTRDAALCGGEIRVERIAVGARRGLANVVAGIADLPPASSGRRVQIEQKGCQFHPYVTVTPPGEVEFVNADPVLHNLRVHSTANAPWTRAQPKSRRVVERFEKPEVIMLSCDVHPWAVGWLAVVPSPYFAVTDSSGVARIEHVPAGRHQVEIWHEVLGRQARDVEVKAGQTTRVAFEVHR